MKTILTLIFVLFIGVAAQAQDVSKEVKVTTVGMGIVIETSGQDVKLETKTEVARLYKFKNSKIKKELSFTTKRNRAKLA
ncbi:hypothetical protein [Costertonia aggregata]|uniref:SIMPL domain-containing protein n=1 Tax=Costertonia aggregata TaxID=343403 RepID=A0A7H9ASE8_9FLAO|nr:hypothetical protein [Costertonia aggregata]QLG46356.1 hypothetical protein HYG79_13695 [Costertonia aggregata]